MDAYFNLGVACGAKGMIDNEISAYKKVVEIDPDNLEAFYNLGHAYRDKEMYDESIAAYNRVIEIDPAYIDAYFNLGVSYGKRVCWIMKSCNTGKYSI